VIDGKKAKGSLDANRKDKTRKARQSFPRNEMIGELRKELRLIDKAVAALTKLSRLRQQG
jgi:hypothetical protein